MEHVSENIVEQIMSVCCVFVLIKNRPGDESAAA